MRFKGGNVIMDSVLFMSSVFCKLNVLCHIS